MFVFVIVFFFFKQKTAYEMRISDWSSDVCSSDLQDDARYSRNSLHCGGRRTSGRQKKRAGLFESAGNKGRSGRASGVMFASARDPFLPPAKGTAPSSIDGFVPSLTSVAMRACLLLCLGPVALYLSWYGEGTRARADLAASSPGLRSHEQGD